MQLLPPPTKCKPMSHTSGIVSCNSTHTTLAWILDTGATSHMIYSPSLFTHNVVTDYHTVKLPNRTTATATHVDDIRLSEHLTLQNVLCVLAFSFNLISARSLTSHSNYCCLIFIFGFVLCSGSFFLDNDWSGEGA